MELSLYRNYPSSECTIGDLFINGVWLCYILEDVERNSKIAGRTAIPRGRYLITITYSNRFKRYLPLLNNIPNYDGVRIHPGNTAIDTEGCLLPGMTKTETAVYRSKEAFTRLYWKLTNSKTENWLSIFGPSDH